MFMAWRCMCFAAAKDYRLFDFGRSSIGSSTYKFKLEWNSRIIPVYWYQWSAQGKKAMELDPQKSSVSRRNRIVGKGFLYL